MLKWVWVICQQTSMNHAIRCYHTCKYVQIPFTLEFPQSLNLLSFKLILTRMQDHNLEYFTTFPLWSDFLYACLILFCLSVSLLLIPLHPFFLTVNMADTFDGVGVGCEQAQAHRGSLQLNVRTCYSAPLQRLLNRRGPTRMPTDRNTVKVQFVSSNVTLTVINDVITGGIRHLGPLAGAKQMQRDRSK